MRNKKKNVAASMESLLKCLVPLTVCSHKWVSTSTGLYLWIYSQSATASRSTLDSVFWLAVLCFSYEGLQGVLAGSQVPVWHLSTLSRLYSSLRFLLFWINSFLFSTKFLIPIHKPILHKFYIIIFQEKFLFSVNYYSVIVLNLAENKTCYLISTRNLSFLGINRYNTYH